jgi:hypothetical protein
MPGPDFSGWVAANIGWIVVPLTLVALVALGLSGWLAIRLNRVEQRYRALTAGANGGNLQQVLEAHVREVRVAMDRVQELDNLAHGLERDGKRHMQRSGFLRFNPFRDAGGDQSFTLALTDQDGNGFVMSSLHSRDVTRVYGKPLVGWDSAYALTDEETLAIQKAKAQL